MIVGERKPLEEIIAMIRSYKRVLNIGCGGCTSICLAGGQREADILNAELGDHFAVRDAVHLEVAVDPAAAGCHEGAVRREGDETSSEGVTQGFRLNIP